MAVQAQPQANAKRTRAKKGEGPVIISFVNAKNELSNKVTADVDALQVKNKAGKTKNYPISAFGLPVLKQLATDNLKKRFASNAANAVKADSAVDIFTVIDSAYENIKSGKIVFRSEGAKTPGRIFDFDFWASVMLRASELKNKKNSKVKIWSSKVLDEFRKNLEATSPADRKTKTVKWQTDPVISYAVKQLKAERAAAKADEGGDYDALSDI